VENKARKDDVLKEMEHIDDEMKRMAKRKEEILKDVDSINANLNSRTLPINSVMTSNNSQRSPPISL
jgi:predicted  nucleic acid-binding Zn-ribbon protein